MPHSSPWVETYSPVHQRITKQQPKGPQGLSDITQNFFNAIFQRTHGGPKIIKFSPMWPHPIGSHLGKLDPHQRFKGPYGRKKYWNLGLNRCTVPTIGQPNSIAFGKAPGRETRVSQLG